eukprot:CAMPEP_0201628906 /NCGR_PEP_ID=MMETSP0493-20130528/3739_1 /ASSEMBLY_ACC=CAM_ASM_000838 /TAXON_ID=420259 /ORGANISM="Thalassiosira gravida, Strain GMp14c1" /LENGTH=276 /DNA_ID=CAMNT_0048099789 /DNA_START=399 /DNA_END=1226 /DNA_ORIENTATION=-
MPSPANWTFQRATRIILRKISALYDPYFRDEADDSQRLHSDATVDIESVLLSDRRLYKFRVRGGEVQRIVSTSTTMTTTTGGAANDNNGNHRTLFTDDGTFEEFYASPDGRRRSYKNGTLEEFYASPDGRRRRSYKNGRVRSSNDDDNFETLTVVAIVIDNPTAAAGEVRGGGMSMVHEIKETSVLWGKIRVGDLLITVDDVDCQGMSATQVTRVISGRSRNKEMILVLLRGSSGASALGNCVQSVFFSMMCAYIRAQCRNCTLYHGLTLYVVYIL